MSDEDEFGPETKLEKIKRRIKASREAFRAQRDREEADLAFQVPEMQWDATAAAARRGGFVNGVATSARPMLSVSKIAQPIRLVNNQARQAKLGVNIHPVSEKAKKETAEVLQGLYDRIQRDSNADHARLWAFDRASKAGMGAYLVTTTWDEDAPDDSWDQEITIQRILYQSLTGWDPGAQEPDFSDGEYSWMAAYVPVDAFKRDWPDATLSLASESEFSDLAAKDADWFAGSGRDRKILVVTCWYKEHDYEELSSGEGKDKKTRKRDVVTIRCAKITSADVLEDEETNGHLLPLIPVIGEELQPFGTERRWAGMIGPAKDAQRMFNFSASSFVESMAAEPRNPWMLAEGQEEGHETEFAQANVRPMPYVRYKPTSLNGQPTAPPFRQPVDTSKMQLSAMGMQEADAMIQAATSIYDPSLGRNNPRDKSGKAILALQSQADAGTSHYLAALADISLTYEARVVLDLMPAIYDRPGRVCRILTGEDKDKVVMLNKPFVEDEDGYPVEAREGDPGAKHYKIERRGYSVSTSIGKSFQTRLQQGSEQIGEILQAAPALLPVIGDIYFKFQDIPGAPEIAKRLEKWREMQMPGLGEGEEGQQPTAEQLQAQIQAMQQQGQQMGQQLQMAMEQIKTEQAKQQAAMMKAQLDAQTAMQTATMEAQKAIRIAEMNNARAIRVAEINATKDVTLQDNDIQEEQLATGLKIHHEVREAERDRLHETRMKHEEMAHETAMAAAGGQTMTRRREGGQEQSEEPQPEAGP